MNPDNWAAILPRQRQVFLEACWDVFGLPNHAQEKSIANKIRLRLIRKLHPDKNRDNEAEATDRMKALNNAWDYMNYNKNAFIQDLLESDDEDDEDDNGGDDNDSDNNLRLSRVEDFLVSKTY